MAHDTARLVAIDAAHGPDVLRAATRLHKTLTNRDVPCGISRWDASGLFSDVVAAPENMRDVSPRTLMLLYAADLAFRLRWEIGPALEQGVIVIAAPYITSAIAFGVANGLSSDWLSTLFRFAPSPHQTVIMRDDRPHRSWKRKPERGLCECCTTLLEATPEGFSRKKTRVAMLSALSTAAEQHAGLARKRDLPRLATQLIDDQAFRKSKSRSRAR